MHFNCFCLTISPKPKDSLQLYKTDKQQIIITEKLKAGSEMIWVIKIVAR